MSLGGPPGGPNVGTVLVADDNSNIQKMVALALEGQGIRVVAVGNGEAAVRKLGEVQPDVVLADVFMPVRNGYEVCEFVKNDSRFAHIPVILLIGAFDPLDENEARRVGANGVLKKPFVPPDPLIAMVTGFVAGVEKRHGAVRVPATQETPAPAPPLEFAAPEPEPAVEPEPDSPPEEFAVGRGPLSLRDEDRETEKPAAAPAVELPSEERWEERLANWRREAIGYEIPADISEQSNESSESETGRPAFVPEESAVPEAVLEEPPQAPFETPLDPSLASNPTEWMEMMSASAHRLFEEPEPTHAGPPSAEIEARQSIFEAKLPEPELPTEETEQPSSETVILFPAHDEAEALPEIFHEHGEAAATETHADLLPTEHPLEASSFEPEPAPEPTPELFGFLPSSYAAEATESDARFADEHSYEEVTSEPEPAGSHVDSYSAPQSLDPALVDAVVAKVLERIEPQLRNILTRELLRPLAESLLERELQKK